MRLREIEQILSTIDFDDARLKVDYTSDTLSNLNSFKSFLRTIAPLSIYESKLNQLSQSALYETTQDSFRTAHSTAQEIYVVASYLINSASSLSLVFKELLPTPNPESIHVKFPEPSDFESLIKNMSTLQKSLSQVVVHKDIDGYVKVNNWEHGSFWIELILGTQAAVAVVSSIAWAAAVVSKKYNESKILERSIRAMDIKNESLEDILEKQKEMTRLLVEAESNQVIAKHYTDKDPEHLKRIEASIKTFAKLIQDGAEVHPALMAPEQVQNLFPDYKKIGSISSQIKRLEQFTDDSSDS